MTPKDRQTDGHGDSMTESAQRANTVKMLIYNQFKGKSQEFKTFKKL